MQKKIRLIIADDSKLTVVGLNTMLKMCEWIDVIKNAENGEMAVIYAQELKPDVILMDIGMPVIDGIQATKKIKDLGLESKIIMLTSHDSEQDVFDALSAGANSYCMKDIDPEILLTVIKTTYEGASWLDPRIAKIVLSSFVNQSVKISKFQNTQLTEREVDVLNLIAKGYSNPEISETLYISMNTVKTHIKNIFQKLKVDDRTQAVVKAFKDDIIQEE